MQWVGTQTALQKTIGLRLEYEIPFQSPPSLGRGEMTGEDTDRS